MSAVRNISFDKFPKQGGHVGREAKVCFHYDTSKTLKGVIVRNDREEPFLTIIKLEDGRHVLATECQYSPQ